MLVSFGKKDLIVQDRILFSSNGVTHTLDLALAWGTGNVRGGESWGDEVRSALTCAIYAEEESFNENTGRIQEASELFRIERGLVTVEDTETWLSERGLTIEDFGDHFVRQFWFEHFAGERRRNSRPGGPSGGALDAGALVGDLPG